MAVTKQLLKYEVNLTKYYDIHYARDHKFWDNVDIWLTDHVGEWDIDWSYGIDFNMDKTKRHIFYFKNEEDKILFALTWC